MASPGQYQYGPDWHHAMLGWPTLGPVNPSHEMAGGGGGGTGSVTLLSLDHYIRSSFFSLRKYLGVLVSTEKF